MREKKKFRLKKKKKEKKIKALEKTDKPSKSAEGIGTEVKDKEEELEKVKDEEESIKEKVEEGFEKAIEDKEKLEEEKVEEKAKEEEKPKEKPAVKEEKKEVITFQYKALNKILRHGLRFSSPGKPKKEWVECMGFLIGNVSDDIVEIKDAIPMVHGNIVEVEFGAEHYARADEINQRLTDDNWVVGWYHTHPGHGLFLSRVDKINHSGYQSLNSKAIALVFDPSAFKKGILVEEYMKIFRLKNPEFREDSGFVEVENIQLKHPLEEVMNAFYESSMLSAREFPLILEYGEDYKKEVKVVTEKPKITEKDIMEMRDLMKNMRKEIKVLHGDLEKHMASTRKSIEKLKEEGKIKEGEMPKRRPMCKYCGYDSIMPGDKICGSCGMKL